MSTQNLLENLKKKCLVAKQEYEHLSNAIKVLEDEINLLDEVNPYFVSTPLKKTNAEAAYEFLKKMNRPCSLDEIAKALLNQGIKTTSKDFPRMVRSILSQLEKKGTVVRENGKWKSI